MNKTSVLLLVAVSILMLGCKKNPESTLGNNLHPSEEYLYAVFDETSSALAITGYSQREAFLDISNGSHYQLGSIYDPIFGVTTANVIIQMNPATTTQPPANAIVDSVVLFLYYDYNSDGSSRTYPSVSSNSFTFNPFILDIFELDEVYTDETAETDSLYSNRVPKYKEATPLVENFILRPAPFDTITLDSTTVYLPCARISFDKEFGSRLLQMSESEFTNPGEFKDFFPGFYFRVRPESAHGRGSMMTIDFSDYSNNNMYVYYRDPEDPETEQKPLILTFEGTVINPCFGYNEIQHDYSLAHPDLQAQLAGDTSIGRKNIFLQAAAGIDGKISLPMIKELKNERIIINQAKLILNIDAADDHFPPPDSLEIYYYADDVYHSVKDAGRAGGGKNENAYHFYITRYLQDMLYHDAENYELSISPVGKHTNSYGVRLFGTDPLINGDQRIKLEIIYTKLP